MLLVAIVAVWWKTRSYFLAIFGTSVLKPDLKSEKERIKISYVLRTNNLNVA